MMTVKQLIEILQKCDGDKVAVCANDPADHPPTWLAELSSACDSCEINGGEAIDHENG